MKSSLSLSFVVMSAISEAVDSPSALSDVHSLEQLVCQEMQRLRLARRALDAERREDGGELLLLLLLLLLYEEDV